MKVLSGWTCAALVLAACAAGDQIGTFPFPPVTRYRAENGLILSWKGNQSDPKDEIKVYDLSGKVVAHFGLLALVPEAKSVSIHDVSAQPGQGIAVAAVYVKPAGVEASLLLFGFDGKLRSAFALAPTREIGLLALDDKSNIWTVTVGAGGQPPSAVPMIVEYDSSGREIRKLLTRDTFSTHAQLIRMTSVSGHPNMGYDSGTVWFWLPSTTDLVTIKSDTGEVNRFTTGLPNLADGVVPFTVFRLSGSQYILSTRNRNIQQSPDPADLLYS